MGSEFNQQELESCLAKCVVCFGLRDILTKTGIPSDETVKLHIEYGDKILVRNHEIPKKSPKIAVIQQVTDFGEEINDFFNRAEAFDGLLSMLPKSELSEDGITRTLFKLIFDIGSFQFGEPSVEYPRLQIIKPMIPCCPPYPCHICRP